MSRLLSFACCLVIIADAVKMPATDTFMQLESLL